MGDAPKLPLGGYKQGQPSLGFHKDFLERIKVQLQAMIRCLDPAAFAPIFGYTMGEQCEMDDPLTRALDHALDLYSRIRPKDVQSKG